MLEHWVLMRFRKDGPWPTEGLAAPSMVELGSLLDPTVPPPTLPPGHPFLNIDTLEHSYWSATTNVAGENVAWHVDFRNCNVLSIAGDKGVGRHLWCARSVPRVGVLRIR